MSWFHFCFFLSINEYLCCCIWLTSVGCASLSCVDEKFLFKLPLFCSSMFVRLFRLFDFLSKLKSVSCVELRFCFWKLLTKSLVEPFGAWNLSYSSLFSIQKNSTANIRLLLINVFFLFWNQKIVSILFFITRQTKTRAKKY